MAVDVETEIEIERGRADVAAYASNPDNAPILEGGGGGGSTSAGEP